jgi:hypothetical protein
MDLSNLIQSHQIFYGISSCKHGIGQDTDCITANGTTSVITLPLAPALSTHISSVHPKLPLKGLTKPFLTIWAQQISGL